MGLLDALLNSDSYGGQGGGLLDFLRPQQPTPDYGQAANVPVGNYMMPQFGSPSQGQSNVTPQLNPQPSAMDNAQWPVGPIGAPSQANAQMQPTAPQQPASLNQVQQTQQSPTQSDPSFGSRVLAGLQGFSNQNPGGVLQHLVNGIGSFAAGQRTDPAAMAQNFTAKALLAKGVDPDTVQAAMGNPEILKAIFQQVYHAAPAGFATDNKGMHFVPGGPADPDYLRLKTTKENDPNAVKVAGRGAELYKVDDKGNVNIIHKNIDNADATLDDATTSAMAAQYLAGDKSVMQNLGRGAQGAANIVKLRSEIYKQADADGKNSKDIVTTFNEQAGNLAGQRAVGTRAANISLAANEASNMIPIALAASDKLPRTQYMPWNQMVQAVQKGTSSPELASFVAATNSLVNSYVRAVSPSGVPTDSMRQHAYDMLNAAQGPEAYKSVVNTMQLEMKAALQAPSQVRKELRGENDAPASQGKAGDAIYAAARDAIAKGAPRDKVLERLKQNGVDASGL